MSTFLPREATFEELQATQDTLYESALIEALVEEGAHVKILSTKRPQYFYNEKQLRDEAAAEVAQQQGIGIEDIGITAPQSRKRKNLNPDEKLEQSRNRNREHAKNTRLRKKAYVIKLKALVDKLSHQKEVEESERRLLGKRIYDAQATRRQALGLFLTYRGSNLRDYCKWAEILDEKVVLKMPITPYRSFHKADIVNNSRLVHGIEGAISDSASLFVMAQGIGFGNPKWITAMKNGTGCFISHQFSADDIVTSGNKAMCHFELRVERGELVGVSHRCVQNGMIKASFNDANRIVSAEIVFDVMGFMQQMQKASSISPECSIVPNTVDMAIIPNIEPRAVMLAEPPYRIVFINDAWTQQCQISQSGIESRPFCQELGTSLSQRETLIQLAADCASCRPGSAVVMAQSKTSPKMNLLFYLRLFPLTGEVQGASKITHILAVLTNLPLMPTEAEAVGKYLDSEPHLT